MEEKCSVCGRLKQFVLDCSTCDHDVCEDCEGVCETCNPEVLDTVAEVTFVDGKITVG